MAHQLYNLYIDTPEGASLSPLRVKVRDYDPDYKLPAEDELGNVIHITLPEFTEIYQPEMIEDDEFNSLVCINENWVKVNSLDFHFM